MEHIHVACATIEHEGSVLCTQRSSAMNMPMKWKFPGGKIELEELHTLDWAVADMRVIEEYRKSLNRILA